MDVQKWVVQPLIPFLWILCTNSYWSRSGPVVVPLWSLCGPFVVPCGRGRIYFIGRRIGGSVGGANTQVCRRNFARIGDLVGTPVAHKRMQ